MSAARRNLRPIGAWILAVLSCHISLGETCDADLNRDGQVNFTDQTILLADYGLLAEDAQNCRSDINRDGEVDFDDLTLLVGAYGAQCVAYVEDAQAVNPDDFQHYTYWSSQPGQSNVEVVWSAPPGSPDGYLVAVNRGTPSQVPELPEEYCRCATEDGVVVDESVALHYILAFQRHAFRVCAFWDQGGQRIVSSGTTYRLQVENRATRGGAEIISSPFVSIEHFRPERDLPALIDQMDLIGVSELIVHATWPLPSDCLSTSVEFSASGLADRYNRLDIVLAEANERGLDIWLGLVSAFCAPPDACDLCDPGCSQNEDWDDLNSSRWLHGVYLSEAYRRWTRMLVERYGDNPSLLGFYIIDEPQPQCWDGYSEGTYSRYGFFEQLVTAIRSGITEAGQSPSQYRLLIAPGIAPRVNGATQETIDEIVAWFGPFVNAGITDFILIDGVGVGADNYPGLRDEQYYLIDFLESLRIVYPGPSWGVVIEAFNWGPHDASICARGGAGRPASIRRLEDQIAGTRTWIPDSPRVDRTAVWSGMHHFGLVSEWNEHPWSPDAARMRAAYKAIQTYNVTGRIHTPSYTYAAGADFHPEVEHRDDSFSKLTDGRMGDPLDWRDVDWVGLEGIGEGAVPGITIHLGQVPVRVDWIGLHVLHRVDSGIRFPERTEFFVYNGDQLVMYDEVDLGDLDNIYLPVTRYDSEWVLQNQCPWGIECTRIEVLFDTWWWTWIDEIEVIDDEFHPPLGFGCEYYHPSHGACEP